MPDTNQPRRINKMIVTTNELVTYNDLSKLEVGDKFIRHPSNREFILEGTHLSHLMLRSDGDPPLDLCVLPSFLLNEGFSKVTTVDLTKLNKRFKDLSKNVQKALLCASIDGAEIERENFSGGYCTKVSPKWNFGGDMKYRVKPKEDPEVTLKKSDIEKAKEFLKRLEQDLADLLNKGGE